MNFALAITAAICGSVFGDLLVKQGSDTMRQVDTLSFGGFPGLLHPLRLILYLRSMGILGNGRLLGGLLLLCVHFVGFVAAMNMAPVSLVVPLMSCTYIGTTLLARFVLQEQVTALRWVSIGIVVAGVVMLSQT